MHSTIWEFLQNVLFPPQYYKILKTQTVTSVPIISFIFKGKNIFDEELVYSWLAFYFQVKSLPGHNLQNKIWSEVFHRLEYMGEISRSVIFQEILLGRWIQAAFDIFRKIHVYFFKKRENTKH